MDSSVSIKTKENFLIGKRDKANGDDNLLQTDSKIVFIIISIISTNVSFIFTYYFHVRLPPSFVILLLQLENAYNSNEKIPRQDVCYSSPSSVPLVMSQH